MATVFTTLLDLVTGTQALHIRYLSFVAAVVLLGEHCLLAQNTPAFAPQTEKVHPLDFDPSKHDAGQLDIEALETITPAAFAAAIKAKQANSPSTREIGPKPSARAIIMERATDMAPGSSAPDASENFATEARAVQAEERRAGISWFDRVGAAIDKNWISQMIVRGLERETYEGDPEWHKEYLKNIDAYEAVAIDQDELDLMRSSRAQNSREDFLAVRKEIVERRARNETINSTGNGWAYELGAFFLDPLKLIPIMMVAGFLRYRSRRASNWSAALKC